MYQSVHVLCMDGMGGGGGGLVAWKQVQRLQSKNDGMARDLLQGSEKRKSDTPLLSTPPSD